MTNRPTPEQIADGLASERVYAAGRNARRKLLVELAEHGYVIVHPDDHPYDCGSIDPEFRSGWKALHHRIFAAEQEPTDENL